MTFSTQIINIILFSDEEKAKQVVGSIDRLLLLYCSFKETLRFDVKTARLRVT